MNKSIHKNFGKIIIALAVVIFIATLVYFVKEPYQDYSEEAARYKTNSQTLGKYSQEEEQFRLKKEEEEAKLKTLKPIYETTANTDVNNTGLYGTMFDELIKLAQANGLMIRSIEYNLSPSYDKIYTNYGNEYNACEFKFFFVGTYNQFKMYLNDVNTQFKYFITLSKLDISSFEENPDYLLIKTSFTLYSKKKTITPVDSGNRNSEVFGKRPKAEEASVSDEGEL